MKNGSRRAMGAWSKPGQSHSTRLAPPTGETGYARTREIPMMYVSERVIAISAYSGDNLCKGNVESQSQSALRRGPPGSAQRP